MKAGSEVVSAATLSQSVAVRHRRSQMWAGTCRFEEAMDLAMAEWAASSAVAAALD